MSYQLDFTGLQLENCFEDLNDKSSVNAYIMSSADTTTTSAMTWYPVQGTFTNELENFVLDVDKIKYVGENTYKFEIDFHAKFASSISTTTANISVSVNGSPLETEKMGVFLKFSGEPGNVSGTAVVELNTNDTLQLVAQSNKAGAVLTFGNFVTTATKFITTRS